MYLTYFVCIIFIKYFKMTNVMFLSSWEVFKLAKVSSSNLLANYF